MSLCSPLWGDDKDSDISEPDSQDRVTIYTTDLSPTASELACMHQVQLSAPPTVCSLPPASIQALRPDVADCFENSKA